MGSEALWGSVQNSPEQSVLLMTDWSPSDDETESGMIKANNLTELTIQKSG